MKLITIEATCINPSPSTSYLLIVGKIYQVYEYHDINEDNYLVNIFGLKNPKAESMPMFSKNLFKTI